MFQQLDQNYQENSLVIPNSEQKQMTKQFSEMTLGMQEKQDQETQNFHIQNQKPQNCNDRFIPNRKITKLDSLDWYESNSKVNQLSTLVSLYQSQVLDFSADEKMLKFNQTIKAKKENIDFSKQPSIKRQQSRQDIAKAPFKILDAPGLSDDFYLNLLDWSSDNLLAVALESTVYLWSGNTNKVTKLCEIEDEAITSLIWAPRGKHLSIGTDSGDVQIWDVNKIKQLQLYQGLVVFNFFKMKSKGQHHARVATLAWSNSLLCSGSRDKSILLRDVRINEANAVKRLMWHKQEVCGLKWNFDEQLLASGGNDNKLLVWNMHSSTPIRKFANHTAAVKAIAWSPHQHGLLVSGGGTADRTIRFWNTEQNAQIKMIDAESQVCNLLFTQTRNELISTHGYSMNQINLWDYPSLDKFATLTGHTTRVLYLTMNPSNDIIVTGAGDETLRFWRINNANSKSMQNGREKKSMLVGNAKELR